MGTTTMVGRMPLMAEGGAVAGPAPASSCAIAHSQGVGRCLGVGMVAGIQERRQRRMLPAARLKQQERRKRWGRPWQRLGSGRASVQGRGGSAQPATARGGASARSGGAQAMVGSWVGTSRNVDLTGVVKGASGHATEPSSELRLEDLAASELLWRTDPTLLVGICSGASERRDGGASWRRG